MTKRFSKSDKQEGTYDKPTQAKHKKLNAWSSPEENLNRNQGIDLIGMGERAALVNGELEIESSIQNGTTIYIYVPASYEAAEK